MDSSNIDDKSNRKRSAVDNDDKFFEKHGISDPKKRQMVEQMLRHIEDEGYLRKLDALNQETSASTNAKAPSDILEVFPDSLKRYLKNHQKEAISFMYKKIIDPPVGFKDKQAGNGAIIAHSMGLGKTSTVVAFLYGILTQPEIKNHISKILIIAPVNAIQHWIDEFRLEIWETFFGPAVNDIGVASLDNARYDNKNDPQYLRMLQVKDWSETNGTKSILIMGYDQFINLVKEPKTFHVENEKTRALLRSYLQAPGPDIAVYDEGHKLKNQDTKTYEENSQILSKRRILLSGTPMQNNLMELFNVVRFVDSDLLQNEDEFKLQYVDPINKGQFKDSSVAEKDLAKRRYEKLNGLLQNVMVRKDENFLKDLIGVNKTEITITFFETREQDPCLQDVTDRYKDNSVKNFLDYTNDLNKITAHPVLYYAKTNNKSLAEFSAAQKDISKSNKTKFLFEILKKCKAEDQKLIVFAESIETLNYIEDQLLNDDTYPWQKNVSYFRVDGKDSNSKKRAKYYSEFNKKDNVDARLFLLSTKAACVGINLTGANRMVLFDHGFNPAYNTQATFRIYRMGQTQDVFIYRFEVKNIDDCMLRRQINKVTQQLQVVDNKNIDPQFDQCELIIKRGKSTSDAIKLEKLEELIDPFLKDIVEENIDDVADFNYHSELFFENPEDELIKLMNKKLYF